MLFRSHHLTFWETTIEFPHIEDIAAAETLSVAMGQIGGQPVQKVAAIFRTQRSTLFKLHNILADVPIGLDQNGIDGCGNLGTSRVKQGADALYKRFITGICRYFVQDTRFCGSIAQR